MVYSLNRGVVRPPTAAGPVRKNWCALMRTFVSGFARPTGIGDHESLEAQETVVEEELKCRWLR